MSLLHTHGSSLNDESLRTLLAETEAIINSRPLMVDMLGDVQSEQPIYPSNILTMKSKVVLPPPGHFGKANEYSRKRWRRIQHIVNEFWVKGISVVASVLPQMEQKTKKFPILVILFY